MVGPTLKVKLKFGIFLRKPHRNSSVNIPSLTEPRSEPMTSRLNSTFHVSVVKANISGTYEISDGSVV